MIRSIAIVGNLLFVCGCMPTVIDSACTAFKPITYSAARDTQETKDQIKEHNAVWTDLCSR